MRKSSITNSDFRDFLESYYIIPTARYSEPSLLNIQRRITVVPVHYYVNFDCPVFYAGTRRHSLRRHQKVAVGDGRLSKQPRNQHHTDIMRLHYI